MMAIAYRKKPSSVVLVDYVVVRVGPRRALTPRLPYHVRHTDNPYVVHTMYVDCAVVGLVYQYSFVHKISAGDTASSSWNWNLAPTWKMNGVGILCSKIYCRSF